MQGILDNFFNLDIYRSVAPILLQGLWMTVLLSILVIPFGLISGLGVAVLYTNARNPLLRAVLVVYIDIFRSIPPLVLLMVIYFGLPFLNLNIPKIVAVVLCFTLNNSCYYGEVFRAGLESLPKGQVEAARSTGLSFMQALFYVQIPQAVRNVMPDLVSNSLEIIKLTTIASAVALPELLQVAQNAQALLYNPSPIILAALLYLLLLIPLVRLISRLERRRMANRH
ncbi:amino acid ABC transporter permease [Paraburkholderia sp. Ac-20336]|uniref:amino acid ABC transporter permease n=1 Tax=Burkholderiaceae TaxID=119060 RepID=UPI00141FDA03|nr:MULTISPECIES: amino acid ABC transporter permease [Burkholderiaceae]MBN3803931.1 amino acid ABC transporter permease [Paraburkholderia sp. Ac-20336]MBN3846379.1 amino acid ABC transporter permease [Paraburkholderia sp. Ac-20342]NIF53447.1 amino acid ABC transporter permease [Burkholderia sp. Ax-1724]NIF78631.1 amino acid ABC transporter permease [Paraburkholderia sp. Cy-641]